MRQGEKCKRESRKGYAEEGRKSSFEAFGAGVEISIVFLCMMHKFEFFGQIIVKVVGLL